MMTAQTAAISGASEPLKVSVRALANWVLDYADQLGQPISNMSLNKLVYFAFEEWIRETNCVLTNAKIEAWDHGPVFREIYHSFKDHKDQPITSRSKFFDASSGDMKTVRHDFDGELEEFLKKVLTPLIPLSASTLRAISHKHGGAWHKVWMYDGHANPGMEITPDIILQSFDRKESTP